MRMWFKEPADAWEKALPIGNGRLGAMIQGGVQREVIDLNQDSIWYGGPRDRLNPDARGHLEEVRKLLLAGKIPEAEEILKFAFSAVPQGERPYQPLGKLEICYEAPEGRPMDREPYGRPAAFWLPEETEGYERELDLDEGIAKESYRIPGRRVRKEYLASYPQGVIAVHLKASEGEISLDALLTRGKYYDHSGKLDDKTIYIDGVLGEGGVSFCAGVRAEAADGTVQVLGDHLVVRNAKEAVLYIACETDFYTGIRKDSPVFSVSDAACKTDKNPEELLLKGKTPMEALRIRLDRALEKGFEAIRKEHTEDYRRLSDANRLQIGEPDDRPLDEQYEDGKKKGFTGAFASLYYQYGRYLLISSSRPGSLPANLQGIWNDAMEPSWDSKYTININTQMNYWPAEICGLSECHLPLFDHMLRMWENGKRAATEMYGCRGVMAHHNTDIWGDCAPQDIYIPATFWVMGAAWLCTHIYTHYLYTKDAEFLKKMFPFMKDAVLFFHDYLIEEDGRLLTCPSVSPENTYILPDGTKGCNGAGVTMDNQILRDLFGDYLALAEVLGVHGEFEEKTAGIMEKLPQNRIGKHGQIMEWREDYDEAEPGHRHISQLYGLHPSHQITVDKTPELAQAAEKTLERRLFYGGGHTGWSCAWIVNFYTRLGKGEKAYENLTKLWRCSTFPNLMDNHPRRDSFVFQIDGNFGAAAGIAEMLLQSDGERTLILPALPAAWSFGEIAGMRLPGKASADLSWKENRLERLVIRAEADFKQDFFYLGKKAAVLLKAGEKQEISAHDFMKK